MSDWNSCLNDGYFISSNIERLNNEQMTQRRSYAIYGPDNENPGQVIKVGNVSTVFSYEDMDLYINGLYTQPKFQGMGVGTFLLRYVANIAGSLETPLKTINLDDMSDKAGDKIGNIYLKLGLKPITDLYEPERKGLVVDVQSNAGWRNFCRKYILTDDRPNLVFSLGKDCPCNQYKK